MICPKAFLSNLGLLSVLHYFLIDTFWCRHKMDERVPKCFFPLAQNKLHQCFEVFEGKKALEAVTSFKTSFVCRASSAGALYGVWQAWSPARHARGCLTERESRTQQSEVKTGREKFCSKLPVTSSYPHDRYLLEKYFYLFLKVTSQNNLRNKSGYKQNAALDSQWHSKTNV